MAMETKMNGWRAYCIHITALPVFFLFFMLLYDPAIGLQHSFSEFYSKHFSLNTIMLSVILLGCMSILRMIYTFLCKSSKIKMTWFAYTLWCLLEMVVCSQFLTLYTSLMVGIPYIQASTICLKMVATTCIFPYLIIALAIHSHEMSEAIGKPAIEDESLVRFYDENQKLKLVIAPSAILYLQSDENYVKINYLESGKLKSYTLRNSMKSLEQVTAAHGLLRCHRSYMINPTHVKVLKKEAEGIILAEMDFAGLDAIPVSKKYYDRLSDIL